MLAHFLFFAPADAYAQVGYGKRFYPETVELEGEAVSATQITLTWRLSNQNRDYHAVLIYRGNPQAPDALQFVGSFPATTVTFTDSNLKPNSTYGYQIKFKGTYITMLSRPSNVVKVKTLDPNTDSGAALTVNVPRYTTADPNIRSAITTLSAKAIGSNKILLQWGAPRMKNVSSLRIFRADPDNPGEFIYLWSIGADKHSWVDETVYPKSTYSYILRYRINSYGAILSPPTNVATATTPDGAGPIKEPLYARKNTLPKQGEVPLSNVQGLPASLNVYGYNSRTSNDSAVPLDGREEELLNAINQYRASLGLGPVRPSISLCRSTDSFAKDLAANGLGVSTTHNSQGQGPGLRARDAGYNIPTQFGTITFTTRDEAPAEFIDRLKMTMREGDVMANPIWKTVGIGRSYDAGGWYWAVDFAAFWDYTIPLPGEDEDGRIDGNELVRTRPPRAALERGSFFSGYGDDGLPYSPLHCDYSTKACWKDPVESYNKALEEMSDADELIGQWHVQATVSSSGITHFNDINGYDMSNYTVNLQINPDKTWVMQGYKAYQKPTPVEAGTWKSVYDISANEDLVTFYRDNGKPAATLRVHAAKNRLTFFVIEGKDFFQSLKFDGDKTDDAQVIFERNFGFLLGPHGSFPANLRCASCPR